MMPRDGKMYKTVKGVECVGVLFSYDYGAGWYSWNPEVVDCLFDAEIVHIVEAYSGKAKVIPQNVVTEIVTMALRKWPDGYWEGASGLCVDWIPVGTKFTVNEYDGAESIETIDDIHWIEA